jgi:hypothetical protein
MNTIHIACRDCRDPDAPTVTGRCTPCSLAAGVADYATQLGIAHELVPTADGRRVRAVGVDGRPAWLDDMTDALYLSRDLAYVPPAPAATPSASRAHAANVPDGWAHAHAACTECGTTKRRHYGRGLCTACYFRRRRRAAANDPTDRIAA